MRKIIFFLTLLIICSSTSYVYAATYTYDAIGRLTSVTYENGQKFLYAYDPAGNLLKVETLVNGSIKGKVTLQGVYGFAGGVQVILLNQAGQEIANTVTNQLGEYKIEKDKQGLPLVAGTYSVMFSKPVFLSAGSSDFQFVTGKDTNLEEIKLLTGDISADNKVNLTDFASLAKIYGQHFEWNDQADWHPYEDLNRNNEIDLYDLVLFAKNYGIVGFEIN